MKNEVISPALLKLRIRNRIIEYLELASDFDKQIKYKDEVPIAHVPAELICMWEDSVHKEDAAFYSAPIFSREEQKAIWAYHEIWAKIADVMNDKLDISELQKTKPWNEMRLAAQGALEVFMDRGIMSEDELFQCPVCDVDLDFTPWSGESASDEICPSCGIQFGYNDANPHSRKQVYHEWRKAWIANNRRPFHGKD